MHAIPSTPQSSLKQDHAPPTSRLYIPYGQAGLKCRAGQMCRDDRYVVGRLSNYVLNLLYVLLLVQLGPPVLGRPRGGRPGSACSKN